ncbi:unnamed protein product [Polarella glacialis]|uniref:Uncharacterized protein n=1 Tax=Polarella glacialis TaxID=89957 RepID=A0A813EV93_POLGL|nr:unnamed protein product [Polarella glacialis]
MYLKLLAEVLLFLGLTRVIVCQGTSLECRHSYDIRFFFWKDFHNIALDLFVVFVIGRIYEAVFPLDSPLVVVSLCCGSAVPSLLDIIPFLKVSLTMYQVMCVWSVPTFIFVGFMGLALLALAGLHAHYFWKFLTARGKCSFLLEMLAIIGVFVVPRAISSSFHAHHWFTAWLAAQLCRFNTAWSRSAQFFFIGVYVNGIALYGRDPVLSCQAAWLLADSQRCQRLLPCTADQAMQNVMVIPP